MRPQQNSPRLILLYRSEMVNFRPACGNGRWFVGRFSAEWGLCSTAPALARAPDVGSNDR